MCGLCSNMEAMIDWYDKLAFVSWVFFEKDLLVGLVSLIS